MLDRWWPKAATTSAAAGVGLRRGWCVGGSCGVGGGIRGWKSGYGVRGVALQHLPVSAVVGKGHLNRDVFVFVFIIEPIRSLVCVRDINAISPPLIFKPRASQSIRITDPTGVSSKCAAYLGSSADAGAPHCWFVFIVVHRYVDIDFHFFVVGIVARRRMGDRGHVIHAVLVLSSIYGNRLRLIPVAGIESQFCLIHRYVIVSRNGDIDSYIDRRPAFQPNVVVG